MNLLRQYIRELLTEAAKGPQDLPAGLYIVIEPHAHGKGAVIHYGDEGGKGLGASYDGPWGEVYVSNIKGREYGPCGDAWKVSASNTGQGWGPMLYDVAMEYATEMGSGLIADRDAVSPEARRVWDYYLSGRGDVTSHQLDNLDNELTPEIEEDNCDQRVAGFDLSRPAGGRYSRREKDDVDWTKSPLSKRYTKEPTTIEALRAAGKLVWTEAGDYLPLRDLDAEGPITHLEQYITELLNEKNVLAQGMCFPFAYQKAEEWFETHFTKGGKGRRPKRHPDLNDKSKFKVVHGTIADKWKKPPKPVVHGWVEMGDLVFDDQSKITKPDGVPKDVYYDMYQPEVYKEFTAEEAVVNCIKYGGEGPWDEELWSQIQQRDAWLQEKALRGKGKDKRLLYHINRFRPAKPQPKMTYLQDWDPDKIDREGGKGGFINVSGTDNWKRHWLDSPVKSGVFLTPNPLDIALNHGRAGHVYAYNVPEWVIDKSGGLHRYDSGSEVLIPEDVWNEAGKEIEFLGKSMDEKELWDKMDSTQVGRGHHRKGTMPSWMSEEEKDQWRAGQDKFNLRGLRNTKHPEDVIKLLKPEERKKAIEAIKTKYEEQGKDRIIPAEPGDRKGIKMVGWAFDPDKKDQELLDLLKKHINESVIRNSYMWRDTRGAEKVKILSRYIREIIRENTYQSHTHEPEVGEMVVNVNPKCKHFGSEGIVLEILSLPGDAGKTIQYQCINDGETWSEGDILEKTMDQLAPMGG